MTWELAVGLVVAALGVVAAVLEARGKARLGRMLHAMIRGAEKGSLRAGTREVKRAICEEAIKAGVQEYLRPEGERETGEETKTHPERDR